MQKRVWEVCEPHPDVFAREMDPSMFAASLHSVETETADPDYTDPERFFAKTYMTRSLESVLERVVGRLAGRPEGGAPVMRLETPFGGGKTHTMVALYHLAKYPEIVETTTEVGERLLQRLNLHRLPRDVRVVVLDGVALEANGRRVEHTTIQTLWGELAYRLGGWDLYAAMRELDERRIAPGQVRISQILRQTQPVLILLDEVLHYLVEARAIRVGDSSLMEQTSLFLRALTVAVSETQKAVLVLSLPASSLEVSADSREQAEELFQHMHKVFGRVELIETPVADDEVFGVLKRRLFRSVGTPQQAKRVAGAFQTYYNEYARFFPDRLRSPSYRKLMEEAYPFHPELIEMLYQRWGPHPQFQRTRGALRLLALVLRRLWNQRPGSAFLIQPHHIDLADRHIRGEVLKLLDKGFDSVISADVLRHAKGIDRDLGGEYRREELSKGAATCALLYSVSAGMETIGCTEEGLRAALLRPRVNPALVSEALRRLRDELWFLRYRDRYYFFTAKHNLNKIILDYEQGITQEKVEEKIREVLEKVSGKGRTALQVLVAPPDKDAVPEPSQATLIILGLTGIDADGERVPLTNPDMAKRWMKRIVEKTTNRNLLVFLAPDAVGEGRLRSGVKRLLALQNLKNASLFRELDADDKKDVEDQLKEKESELVGILFGMFRRVFRPSREGVQELRVLLKRDAKTLAEAVEQALRQQGILCDGVSPEYLAELMKDRGSVSVEEIETVLTGSLEQPVVVKPKEALRQAIKAGVQQDLFAVTVEDKTYKQQDISDDVISKPGLKIRALKPEAKPEPQEVQEQVAVSLTVETSAVNLYPLRKLLEMIQNTKAGIVLEIREGSGALARKKADITKLLQDYSIPFKWEESGASSSH